MRSQVRYSTLLPILLILSPLCASLQFYIAPSPDLCPGGQATTANGRCLTIEQFAASSADLTLGSNNVTLELVPGDHTLESELFVGEDFTHFVMHSTNASVLCSGANANITFEQIRNVHVSGISFASCTPIKVRSVEDFSLEDSSVRANGIIIVSNTFNATIMRSYFYNNVLTGGNPPDNIMECCSSGGIQVFNSSLKIHQCIYSNNAGYVTGGVYGVISNITITESTFSQNSGFRNIYVNRVPTYGSSGALFVTNGTLLVLNSNFSDNVGERPSGAVFLEGLESLEITGSNFERNRAYSGCGALDITEAFMSVISLSKFVNNSDGAACITLTKFTSQGSVAIIESTFIGHVGRSALSLTNRHEGNDMSISNSVFAHNNASGFGGAIIFDGGPLTISRSNFTSNSASGIGGALCVRSGNVVVNDSSFVGNTAVTVYSTESRYQEGGAVVVQYGNFTTYRTEFIDNTGSNGGGIHVYTGNIFVHNSIFKRNAAKGIGGAIAACACRLAANITITDSRFSWNTADSQCGAVHFLGIQSVNLISGSTFSNNGKFSTRSGGAACAKGVTLSILNSKFRRNLALLEGGVFFVSSHSRVSVSQSKFDHNIVGISTPYEHTSGSGGVFNIERGSRLQVDESTFTNNYAKQGGVFGVDSASLEVNETDFYGNNATLGTLIAACSRSNISLDFDVTLNSTTIGYRNCTLYDPYREISTSITQVTSTIIPISSSAQIVVGPSSATVSLSTQFGIRVSSAIVSPSPQIAVGFSSTYTDLEQSIAGTIYPSRSTNATSKGMLTTSYSPEEATTGVLLSTINHSHTSVKLSSNVMEVSTMSLSSPMIQLTVTPFSAAYYTPASLSVMSSSDSGPIVSSVADLSTEEGSTISNFQVARPNLGMLIAIPIAILFVAGLIVVISLIIIIYTRKSKKCKTVNILTNKKDSSYTHIPLVEADGEK